jgi:hypothetical protein
VRQPNGKVKLNQLLHPTAAGAMSGAVWGMLIGWLFLMPVAGAAIGAASGALGLSDPELFGPHFRGPSWSAWRAFIAALSAAPMSDEQVALFPLDSVGSRNVST